MGRILSLDTVLSATEHYRCHWSVGLESNKAGRILRYLITRLWDRGRGKLVPARLDLAQISIARRLNLSRQWVGILSHRLVAAGWIEVTSSKLPDGTNSSSVWRIGRTLKRLLVMLSKSRQGERQIKNTAKSPWYVSPLLRVRENPLVLQKEKEPPSREALLRMPVLAVWMGRG